MYRRISFSILAHLLKVSIRPWLVPHPINFSCPVNHPINSSFAPCFDVAVVVPHPINFSCLVNRPINSSFARPCFDVAVVVSRSELFLGIVAIVANRCGRRGLELIVVVSFRAVVAGTNLVLCGCFIGGGVASLLA